MAKIFTQVLLLVFIIMKFSSKAMSETTISDQVAGNQRPSAECPYPCLPPPTAVNPQICPPPPSPPSPPQPSTSTPPPPSGGSSGYYSPPPPAGGSSGYYNPPPPASGYYPPPTGYLPYYPPPSYINYHAPPPPDPILPYFPFYFKYPPPAPNYSSASSLKGSLGLILNLISLGSFAFFNL